MRNRMEIHRKTIDIYTKSVYNEIRTRKGVMSVIDANTQWAITIVIAILQIIIPIVWQIAWPSLQRKMKRRAKQKPQPKRKRVRRKR